MCRCDERRDVFVVRGPAGRYILCQWRKPNGTRFRPTYKPDAPASACISQHVAKSERSRWRVGLVQQVPLGVSHRKEIGEPLKI